MSVPNRQKLYEDIATLKANAVSQGKQIGEIHKALMGNGQQGIIAEWNQWKGAVKFFGWVTGICIALLSVSVSVLAYLG